MLCYVMLYYDMLCYVTLRSAGLAHVMLHPNTRARPTPSLMKPASALEAEPDPPRRDGRQQTTTSPVSKPRPRLVQAKSMAVDTVETVVSDETGAERWPPVAPPRARKRQSVPFVQRATQRELAAAEMAAARSAFIGALHHSQAPSPPTKTSTATTLSECPKNTHAEIDRLQVADESNWAHSDESRPLQTKVEPVLAAQDELIQQSSSGSSRQPAQSSATSFSTLFTKLLGKLLQQFFAT